MIMVRVFLRVAGLPIAVLLCEKAPSALEWFFGSTQVSLSRALYVGSYLVVGVRWAECTTALPLFTLLVPVCVPIRPSAQSHD